MRRDCGNRKKRRFIRCEEECGETALCMFCTDRVISRVTRRVITPAVLYALLSDDDNVARHSLTHSTCAVGAANALSRRIVARYVHPPVCVLAANAIKTSNVTSQTDAWCKSLLQQFAEHSCRVCADCCVRYWVSGDLTARARTLFRRRWTLHLQHLCFSKREVKNDEKFLTLCNMVAYFIVSSDNKFGTQLG
jgi:hypothetical protein